MPADGGTTDRSRIPGILWANRRGILFLSILTALATLVTGFFLTRYYRAEATLLPETETNNLSGITQFADVAQLTGILPAQGEMSRLYPAILESETVLLEVIGFRFQTERFRDSVDLITYFGLGEDTPEEEAEQAIETMHELLGTSYDNKTGIVTVTMEMPEPRLAADVLNRLVDGLDRFMRVKRVTSASEQLRWIVSRLGEVEEELKGAEDSLRSFRDRNRRISDSPGLLMQQQRLIREVEISSTTFVELKKQYELAKIEEIKNTSLINILDEARPPIRHERPRKLMNTLLMFIIALILLSAYYVVRALYIPRAQVILRSLKG